MDEPTAHELAMAYLLVATCDAIEQAREAGNDSLAEMQHGVASALSDIIAYAPASLIRSDIIKQELDRVAAMVKPPPGDVH